MARKQPPAAVSPLAIDYDGLLGDVASLLETARRSSARAVNAIMTATYWEIGRRIVETEQGGAGRADYGRQLLSRLAEDLSSRFGRGFSRANLEYMRRFYECWPMPQTASGTSLVGIPQTVSGESASSLTPPEIRTGAVPVVERLAGRFPLPWSHYVKLMAVRDEEARRFYETEALRGGWSVRQLDRQIASLFHERTLLSRNKGAMLRKGARPEPGDAVSAEEEIKDPLVLEFLDLKDEYSEHELEAALIRRLEEFLLELGGDFAFVGRQRRLRIGEEWYRVDLLFFHRRLRCLVVIDLKLGKFTHADAGQMHLYLNYAREHWTNAGENPPVGLVLCARRDEAVARYSLEGLPNKVLAAEYRLALPDERVLAEQLQRTQRRLASRGVAEAGPEAAPRTAKPGARGTKTKRPRTKRKD